MYRKNLGDVEIKDTEEGRVAAVFSTFDVIDSHGDVTKSDAFTHNQNVLISAYNHQSWGGALPVGKGVIKNEGGRAVMHGQFFMTTQQGRDTFKTVKELSDSGLQEWSYGYDVDDSDFGDHEGKSVRFLKKLTVHEVSPVLKGAGVGTETLMVKAYGKRDFSQAERDRLAEEGKALPDGSFPIVNREDLENAIGLAGHADDPAKARRHIRRRARDLDAEEMIPESWSKSRFAEHAESVLTDVSEFRARAAEVVAKRLEEKGRGLGEESESLVRQISDELKALDQLFREPESKNESQGDAAELQQIMLRQIAQNL